MKNVPIMGISIYAIFSEKCHQILYLSPEVNTATYDMTL